jgi:hypothetical protein
LADKILVQEHIAREVAGNCWLFSTTVTVFIWYGRSVGQTASILQSELYIDAKSHKDSLLLRTNGSSAKFGEHQNTPSCKATSPHDQIQCITTPFVERQGSVHILLSSDVEIQDWDFKSFLLLLAVRTGVDNTDITAKAQSNQCGCIK